MYPTAIGSEPHDSSLDTRDPWRRAMQGHAVSNVIPVAAANRIGHEPGAGGGQSFYGSSFIADHRGDLVAELDREAEGVLTATFDLDFLATHRAAWGFFRDRRTDLYEGAGPPPRLRAGAVTEAAQESADDTVGRKLGWGEDQALVVQPEAAEVDQEAL